MENKQIIMHNTSGRYGYNHNRNSIIKNVRLLFFIHAHRSTSVPCLEILSSSRQTSWAMEVEQPPVSALTIPDWEVYAARCWWLPKAPSPSVACTCESAGRSAVLKHQKWFLQSVSFSRVPDRTCACRTGGGPGGTRRRSLPRALRRCSDKKG